MPDPVKKKKGKTAEVAKKRKKRVAPTGNQGMKRNSKKKPVNTTSAPAGYSKRTRMDMAAKEALSGGVAKKKKKAGQTGYGPQNRLGTFAKKKKVKTTGPRKKGYMKDAAAIAKVRKEKVRKEKVRKGLLKPNKIERVAAKIKKKIKKNKKAMSVAQLRKAGKIQF
jgi:hypothetical protein|tara:strand:- start:1424 stop:1921 length:498 start_codon:yes stop_codon:yes gene_type:complete